MKTFIAPELKESLSDKLTNDRLMALTLDYDIYKDNNNHDTPWLMSNALDFLTALMNWGRIDSVYERTSASGMGKHLLIFIPLTSSVSHMRNMKECLFGLRMLLGDDISRLSADINRFMATHDQGQIMQLFAAKYDSETQKMGYCGKWERLL